MPNSDKVISRGKKNRRAISSPEVKAANAAAKFVAKASAKATADSTPEAIAKAEAKRVAKVILVAKAAVVAEAKPAADAVEREIRAQIAKEGIVKWPTTKDQCMTFALFNTLDRVSCKTNFFDNSRSKMTPGTYCAIAGSRLFKVR
jgi:aminoglycoside N3'-acetyltransferase